MKAFTAPFIYTVFQAPRIYAMVDYWHTTLSWLHVVDLQQTATLMFVLPSDELVVAGGHRPELYKASFRGKILLMTQ